MKSFFRQTSPVAVMATLATSLYLYITQWSELAVIGGFTLHITDLLFGLVVIYCFAGAALTQRVHSTLESMLLLLCALIFFNFARGVMEASYNAAGVQFRNFSGFVALVAFMYFWGREFKFEWITDMIVALGWAIVPLGLARLALGAYAFVREPIDPFAEPRILNSMTALMLGEAALIALNRTLSVPGQFKRWWNAASLLVFLGILLISQQRTATFATLTGFSIIIILAPRYYRSRIGAGAAVVFLGGCTIFWVAWITTSGDLTPYMPRAFSMMAREDSTFGWRLEQWEDYGEVYSREPLLDQIIGQSMGALRLAADEHSMVFTIAHNGYVQLLLSTGTAGVSVFVLVMIWAALQGLSRLKSANSPELSSRLRLAVAIVGTHIVHSTGYVLPNEQGLLLAMAIQLISPAERLSGRAQRTQSGGPGNTGLDTGVRPRILPVAKLIE